MNVNDRMIGGIRVTRIEEMSGAFVSARDWYRDFNEDELAPHAGWLAPDYYDASSGKIISSIHSWVLRQGGRTILIDTCVGNDKSRPGWDAFHMLNIPFLERLRAAGIAPEQVDVVLCTHLHVDHVGWNTRLDNGRWVPTFPNARYLISREDNAFYSAAAKNPTTSDVERNTYNDSVLPVVEAGLAVMLDGTEEIDKGLTIHPAPGHTPGHIRIDMASGGRHAVFSGDAFHNPLQIPLWRWRTTVCTDPNQACKSRRDILEHCVERDALMLPAHFPDPHGTFIDHRNGEFLPSFQRARK